MKRFLIVSFFIVCFISLSSSVNAEEDIVASSTKYYKTISYVGNNNMSFNNNISITYEITEEEYNNANISNEPKNSSTIETTYKRMTTSITKNGSYYRYKNVLYWKNIPSTRSYDIIGIGHFSTVKVHGSTHFEQYYCLTSGPCYTTTTNYPQTFSVGAGTSFLLPPGNLSTLKQTFYFDVEKNTSLTIITQEAYGDYSHAITNVSLNNSKKYTVNYTGISLDGSIINSYDSINKAQVVLNETW
jgi:hypothetical protein